MKAYVPPDNPRKISQRCFTGKQKGLIRMLREKGWTYKKIAVKFYCSIETARRYCTKY